MNIRILRERVLAQLRTEKKWLKRSKFGVFFRKKRGGGRLEARLSPHLQDFDFIEIDIGSPV